MSVGCDGCRKTDSLQINMQRIDVGGQKILEILL